MFSLRSLRVQLVLLSLLMLIVCVALAFVIFAVYVHGVDTQVERARGTTERTCRAVQSGYASGAREDNDRANGDVGVLTVLLERSLRDAPGVEGGVWSAFGGFLAHAFPSYAGSGAKQEVAEAERARIATVAARAAGQHALVTDVKRGNREALVLTACPLSATLAAWTLTRVSAGMAQAFNPLNLGLGVLLLLTVVSGGWLGTLLYRRGDRADSR
jgi:hypothetical protein